jgi:uncharacterized protein
MNQSDTRQAAGPRQVFERFQQNVLSGTGGLTRDLCAQGIVVEQPFSPIEGLRRMTGRDTFIAFAEASAAALLVRFEEFTDVVVHDTTDPQTAVIEYGLTGTLTTTGDRSSARFVVVLTVHDGLVVHWREYQDTMAMARALGG